MRPEQEKLATQLLSLLEDDGFRRQFKESMRFEQLVRDVQSIRTTIASLGMLTETASLVLSQYAAEVNEHGMLANQKLKEVLMAEFGDFNERLIRIEEAVSQIAQGKRLR